MAKKRFWKIEYSIILFAMFIIFLLFIPANMFSSKTASYISKWNDTYNKIDYMFTAMTTQADENIVKGLNNAKSNQKREELMILLTKPYLRINDSDEVTKRYRPHYMNGQLVKTNDLYFFNNYYRAKSGIVMGVKDLDNKDVFHPGFIMMFDMNGTKRPNVWGKDIYGVNIFSDGKISPIGSDWGLEDVKKDCSPRGRGVSCSHYYRIGGEIIE